MCTLPSMKVSRRRINGNGRFYGPRIDAWIEELRALTGGDIENLQEPWVFSSGPGHSCLVRILTSWRLQTQKRLASEYVDIFSSSCGDYPFALDVGYKPHHLDSRFSEYPNQDLEIAVGGEVIQLQPGPQPRPRRRQTTERSAPMLRLRSFPGAGHTFIRKKRGQSSIVLS